MRYSATLSLFLLLTCGRSFSQGDPLARGWDGEKKLIVVTTPGWNSVTGSLIRYERRPKAIDDRLQGMVTSWHWEKVSEPIPVVVGHSGLAWDPDLARGHSNLYPGPVKHEGDGRSPAGVFQLKHGTFGFAPSLPGSLNYRPLTPTVECVDDPASRYYAQIVDRQTVDHVDWKSSEKMRSVPGYRWGVVVNYNMDHPEHPVRGNGSCIFLHQWSGPASGTAGCTAMSADDIEAIVRWVDGKERAVLVQLPYSEYRRLRKSWNLP
jgi:D-alanyl-D-alanine dipeptidase